MLALWVWLVIVHQLASSSCRNIEHNESEVHSKDQIAHFLLPLLGSDVIKDDIKVQVIPYHDYKNKGKGRKKKKPESNTTLSNGNEENLPVAVILAEAKRNKANNKLSLENSNESIDIKHVVVKGKHKIDKTPFWKKVEDENEDDSHSDSSNESSIFIRVKKKTHDKKANNGENGDKMPNYYEISAENSEESSREEIVTNYRDHRNLRNTRKKQKLDHHQYHSESDSTEQILVDDRKRNLIYDKHDYYKTASDLVKHSGISTTPSHKSNDIHDRGYLQATQGDNHYTGRHVIEENIFGPSAQEDKVEISEEKRNQGELYEQRASEDYISSFSAASDVEKSSEEVNKNSPTHETSHNSQIHHNKEDRLQKFHVKSNGHFYIDEHSLEARNPKIVGDDLHLKEKDLFNHKQNKHSGHNYNQHDPHEKDKDYLHLSQGKDFLENKQNTDSDYNQHDPHNNSDIEFLKKHLVDFNSILESDQSSESEESLNIIRKLDHSDHYQLHETDNQGKLETSKEIIKERHEDLHNNHQSHTNSKESSESSDRSKSSEKIVTTTIDNHEVEKHDNVLFMQAQDGHSYRNAENVEHYSEESSIPMVEKFKIIPGYINSQKDEHDIQNHSVEVEKYDSSHRNSNGESIAYNYDDGNKYDITPQNTKANEVKTGEQQLEEVMSGPTENAYKGSDVFEKAIVNINSHPVPANTGVNSEKNMDSGTTVVFIKGGQLIPHDVPIFESTSKKSFPNIHEIQAAFKNAEEKSLGEITKNSNNRMAEPNSKLKKIKEPEVNNDIEEDLIIAEVNYRRTVANENEQKDEKESKDKIFDKKSKNSATKARKNNNFIKSQDIKDLKIKEKQILEAIASYVQKRAYVEAKKYDHKKSYNLSFLFNRR